jgi:hypothetical protein
MLRWAPVNVMAIMEPSPSFTAPQTLDQMLPLTLSIESLFGAYQRSTFRR